MPSLVLIFPSPEMPLPLYSWCASPYSDAIHSFYKSKEEHRPQIKFQSPQAGSRNVLVDWIRTVAEKYRFSKHTVHLAVYILDQFMDNHNIVSYKLGVVAMVCILIASKFEDEEGRTPRINSLLTFLPRESREGVTAALVVSLERFILNSIHWRLGWPTVASFSEYYCFFAVVSGDKDSKSTPHRSLKSVVQSSYDIFLDRTLLCIDLVNAARSNIAAACLLAARIHNSVVPAWPDALCAITWFSYEHLRPVAHLLLSIDNNDVDSGYSASPEARSVREALEEQCASTP